MRFELAIWQPNANERTNDHEQISWDGTTPIVLTFTDGRLALSNDDRGLHFRLSAACNHALAPAQPRVTVDNLLSEDLQTSIGSILAPGDAESYELPLALRAGDAWVEVREPPSEIEERDVSSISNDSTTESTSAVDSGDPIPGATVARWLDALGALGALQRQTLEDLDDQAVISICRSGDFDAAYILKIEGEALTISASHIGSPTDGICYCRSLAQLCLRRGETVLYSSASGKSVVVAPILASDHSLGVVYAVRNAHSSKPRPITPIEAQWIRLVAGGLAVAAQRVEAEARETRTRSLFEQAFSSQLVSEIIRNPDILDGREREITVLFCDIQQSTRISERLGPQRTHQLLSDVLEYFTTRINDHGGVIIDYYGDGLAAMWNAPCDQPDHALRACRAAIAIAGQIHQINERWSDTLGHSIRIGVGIHTDKAQVGNAGTSQRLKYGPRGQMVTIASRVEHATRDVGVPILITRNVLRQLDGVGVARHVCKARLHGVSQLVDLIELHSLDANSVTSDQVERLGLYQEALECMNAGQSEKAEELFETCNLVFGDAPSQLLLRHARRLAEGRAEDPRVVDLTRH